jgi:hypothetical protein
MRKEDKEDEGRVKQIKQRELVNHCLHKIRDKKNLFSASSTRTTKQQEKGTDNHIHVERIH